MANPPATYGDKTIYKRGLDPSGLAEIASVVGDELAIKGPRLTISAACASGLIALIRGDLLIRQGDADRVLVVAAEASVHPLFIGSFQRLGVLPPPGWGCRPFDQTRRGFLMSEAAAAVWLVPAQLLADADDPGQPQSSRLIIDRFAWGEDATHLTGMDPAGRIMRRVVAEAIGEEPLDLIHAHGTATELNDPAELSAFNAAVAMHETPRRSIPTKPPSAIRSAPPA